MGVLTRSPTPATECLVVSGVIVQLLNKRPPAELGRVVVQLCLVLDHCQWRNGIPLFRLECISTGRCQFGGAVARRCRDFGADGWDWGITSINIVKR